MSEVAKVSAAEFRKNIVFVSSYYDHPLAGLCRWNGELCRFEREYESDIYTVHRLSLSQKIRCLWDKFLFELFVGKHQTYRNGEKLGFSCTRKPNWFWRLMFKVYYMPTMKRLRRRAGAAHARRARQQGDE